MTREEAIAYFEQHVEIMEQPPIHLGGAVAIQEWAKRCDHMTGVYRLAISALREQEERSKACPYCDIAKANEGVKNTVLWVKEPETQKWTMMGKKLLFCPMCGRRLEEA